jgi:tetratricopeptide (TPR) repeat protein
VNKVFPGGEFYQQPEIWPLCGELLLHALSVTEQVEAFNVAKEETANLLMGIATYLRFILAQYPKAREIVERALAIDEASFGSDHPRVAIDVNNLALVLKDLGDLAQARTLFERALAIDEASFGSNHPNVARDVNNLASVLKDLGDLAQARTLFERALAIDEASFGSDHPNVAIDVNNLASVLKALGDLAQARTLFERAIAIFRKFLGDDHPNTRTVRKHLERLIEEMSGKG